MVSPWFTGAIGWWLAGPLGGLFGYAAGKLYNAAKQQQAAAPPPIPPYARASRPATSHARYGFMASLVALTAAMMRVDGRVQKSELEVAKKFFRAQFGVDIARSALAAIRDILDEEIPVDAVCAQVRANMNYSQRMALLHYLFGLAHADGVLQTAEERLLRQIAGDLGIRTNDFQSIRAMFHPRENRQANYAILEVAPTATDEEVRRAYRRMSMKHHPDKVAHLGPEFQKSATEKFQRVNAAYSAIKKERGLT